MRRASAARKESAALEARGEDAVRIASWRIDRRSFVATPVMADGTDGPELRLFDFFEEFQVESH